MIETAQKLVSGSVIRLHPDDNVVVACKDIGLGEPVPSENIVSQSQVSAGYKLATRPIAQGDPVLKYNVTIGFAASDIPAGMMVHSHNIKFEEFDRDYAHHSEFKPIDLLPAAQRASFEGIVRADGRVATRNYIGILSTVNCSATEIGRASCRERV
jgi:altronate hydrolase